MCGGSFLKSDRHPPPNRLLKFPLISEQQIIIIPQNKLLIIAVLLS